MVDGEVNGMHQIWGVLVRLLMVEFLVSAMLDEVYFMAENIRLFHLRSQPSPVDLQHQSLILFRLPSWLVGSSHQTLDLVDITCVDICTK